MKVKVFSASNAKEIGEKIKEKIKEEFQPNLGLIFTSISLGPHKIREEIMNFNFPILGATTGGEIIAYPGLHTKDITLSKSAVIALISMNPSSFSTRMFPARGRDTVELGKQIVEWGRSLYKKPAFFVLGSGITLDADGILEGMSFAAEKDTPLVGGIAGDDGKFEQTFVFNKKEVNDFALMVAVFDREKIELFNVAANGWTGIGTEKTVTSSKGNIVISIDGKPAAELYAEYLNISVEEIARVGVEYPLLLKRPEGGFILRAVLGALPENKALIVAGRVPQGSTIMFSAAAGTGATENVKEIMEKYKTQVPEADFIILFSCIARHLAIGELANEEIMKVEELWKAPLIGFFTYGGFGRLLGSDYDFHNETVSVALFKEKP